LSTQSGSPAPEQTDKVEVLLAILLGIAAVATAFAAFKASLIGDEVISNYNQGIRKVDEASQLYNEGNQYLAQDQAVFLEYVKAAQVGDTELADYIRETLMSEELYNGLGWWEASADATTPFVPENPDYYLPQFDQAIALDEEVDEHFTAAADADEESDRSAGCSSVLPRDGQRRKELQAAQNVPGDGSSRPAGIARAVGDAAPLGGAASGLRRLEFARAASPEQRPRRRCLL
jgi:hypothetical protein